MVAVVLAAEAVKVAHLVLVVHQVLEVVEVVVAVLVGTDHQGLLANLF